MKKKKKKRKEQFEKYDSTVVRTHKVLSLADLHVSVLNYPIPLSTGATLFSLRNSALDV